jgi:hypothetical protein
MVSRTIEFFEGQPESEVFLPVFGWAHGRDYSQQLRSQYAFEEVDLDSLRD